MWIFLPVFVIEYAAAAAAGWRLHHFWSRALACLLIPAVCISAIACTLEMLAPENEWNMAAVVAAAIPALPVSVLGGFTGYAVKKLRAR